MVSSFAHGTYPLLKKIKDWKGPESLWQQSHLQGEKTKQESTAFTATLHTPLPVHSVKIGIGEYNKVKAFGIITTDLQVVIT